MLNAVEDLTTNRWEKTLQPWKRKWFNSLAFLPITIVISQFSIKKELCKKVNFSTRDSIYTKEGLEFVGKIFFTNRILFPDIKSQWREESNVGIFSTL